MENIMTLKEYLSVDPGVSPAMTGVDLVTTKTAQLDPVNEKYFMINIIYIVRNCDMFIT